MPSASPLPIAQPLPAGVDTLYLSLYLDWGPIWDDLRRTLTRARAQAEAYRSETRVTVAGQAFSMQRDALDCHRFQLRSPDLTLLIRDTPGPRGQPNVRLDFRSTYLWSQGWKSAVRTWLGLLQDMGVDVLRTQVARVDLCLDLLLAAPLVREDLEAQAVSRASLDDSYLSRRFRRDFETFELGKKPLRLRIYDKIREAVKRGSLPKWTDVWGLDPGEIDHHVWRVEFEVWRSRLRGFGIDTYEDLEQHIGVLWEYLVGSEKEPGWFSLRTPTANKQRCRRPVSPLWQIVRDQRGEFGVSGELPRPTGPPPNPDKLLAQIGGCAKSWAALSGLTDQAAAIAELAMQLVDRTPEALFKSDVMARTAKLVFTPPEPRSARPKAGPSPGVETA